MGVSERLRAIRQESGLNQEEFGKRVGVSKNTQMRYEKGQRFPDTEYLQCVAQQFGTDLGWLLDGEARTLEDFGLKPHATPEEIETLVASFTVTFGMSYSDFKDLLSWLSLYGDRYRLNRDEQSLLNAYRSTDWHGRRALVSVSEAVSKEDKGAIVSPDAYSVAAMADALRKALEKTAGA